MRHAQLYGGPADGDRIPVGDGELPPWLSVGTLVTTPARQLPFQAHADVYEHVTLDLLAAWRAAVSDSLPLFDHGGARRLEDVPVYVHRPLVSRWLRRP